jgi:DNA-binding response OmpR family regulator
MAEVMLVRWPEDAADGPRLAAAGVAVLYLLAADDDPPTPTTCLEDWVRMPGDDRDLNARVAALEMRAAAHSAPPWLDEQGRLHYRGRLLPLQPREARLADVLIERFGDVATDRELIAAALAGDDPAPTPSLRGQMAQLRLHLRDMELSLRRIRRHGYKLQRL